MISNGVQPVVGYVRDLDAERAGGVDVHIVIADAIPDDRSPRGHGGERRSGDRREVHEGDVGAGESRDGLPLVPAIEQGEAGVVRLRDGLLCRGALERVVRDHDALPVTSLHLIPSGLGRSCENLSKTLDQIIC